MTRTILAANWKMNLTAEASAKLAREFRALSEEARNTELWVAPSFTAIPAVAGELKGSSVHLGAQNVHWEETGAFTGEVSPGMLKEFGCTFSIIGHSECRHVMGETDSLVSQRALGCLKAGLTPVFCIGETLDEREKDLTEQVLRIQLDALFSQVGSLSNPQIVIAYEPVWAIGTGKVASVQNITDAHRFIYEHYKSSMNSEPVAILYGGSVSPENFGEIIKISHVDGGLVGGASLSASKFGSLLKISEASN